MVKIFFIALRFIIFKNSEIMNISAVQNKIDVEKVLRSKNPTLAKAIPPFVVNYLKKIVHQDDLNRFLTESGHLRDAQLIDAGLRFFEITYKVSGVENIPASGRHIFVSNHPLGGLDGLVFISELSKHFPVIKFPVNDILTNIENLSGIFLPINKHGMQDRAAARSIEDSYSSDDEILYFPAGLCSRKKGGVIKDLQWHKSFISKAIQHKRDVIPAFFSGRNSNFFYNLARFRKIIGIKLNIEMLYLADEMFKQKGKEIMLVFGKPIPWRSFNSSRSAEEWASDVKKKVYEIGRTL